MTRASHAEMTAILAVALMVGSGLVVLPGFAGLIRSPQVAPSIGAPESILATDDSSSSTLASGAFTAAPYQEPGLALVGARYVGPADLVTSSNPAGTTSILITLRFSNESRLSPLLQGLQDPASPDYHHYLTAEQFDAEFGGSPSVYNSTVQYFSSFGVTGLTTHPDRLAISFEATPSEVSAMFHAHLGAYLTASGETYYAPMTTPQLPAPLAPYIVDVEGLSNYSEYLTHLAPLASPIAPSSALPENRAEDRAMSSTGPAASSPIRPGGSSNPFPSTTVTSNGLTNTYDRPVNFNLSGHSGSTCDTMNCGDLIQAPDLQVTYNETGLFQKYGYPVNATVAAILWSDTICHSSSQSTGSGHTCGGDGLFNHYCSTLTTGTAAWDFFLPDVTSFWNYTIPAGEPMPTAYSMAETGYTYAYPSGSQGYSASCDDAGAEGENTLDVDMLGAMAPGANVFQVFGGASTFTALDTAFADILSPSTDDFSTLGGFDSSASIADLGNVSAITNSWTTSGNLPAAWTTDLQTSAARGITVLGATGDSGTTVAPPAETANNTYGVVAVGGTTAAINSTTLLRGPPHLAGSTAPYYGVGTGEIGWYEPAGTVDGFSSTLGGTGGVATSTAYYRASWFNASADAVAAANAVRSGDYRAEPDVAAIANDTIIDLDQGPYSLNFTCWVSSGCASISPISTGTASGSSPTVGATYFVGTSIATPVSGGLITTMDYALFTQHQGRVGYLDPTAYAMGQKQYAGQLTLDSFYDISTYTDGGGLVGAYEAKVGYDLATGWGVLDAGNYTQNTLTYPITFNESGLPRGTTWSVTLTPKVGDADCTVGGTVCTNGVTASSNTSTIIFDRPYGIFTYGVTPPIGYEGTAASGSITVDGTNSHNSVTMTPVSEGGTAIAELYTLYNGRGDLQAAYPAAYANLTQFMRLVNWAGGTVLDHWADSEYPMLVPYGSWYVLMTVYDERPDLQLAFPEAYSNLTSYFGLVNWAGGTVAGYWSDGAYSTLAPFGAWYVLMMAYDGRPDLQAAYPDAFTNSTQYTRLVNWAGGTVLDWWTDGDSAMLAPFGYWYVLMTTYDERPDLVAAFPNALENFTSFTKLVDWAGWVVEVGETADSAYPALSHFAYWYALMGVYNGRLDLQAAFPDAYSNFTGYTNLIDWAAWVVSVGTTDSAYSTLSPYAEYY